jgi:hypothetical protein
MTTTKMLAVLGVGVSLGAGEAVADSVGGTGDGEGDAVVAAGGEPHDNATATTSAR